MKKLLDDLSDNAQQSLNTERINSHFCVARLMQIKITADCHRKYLYIISEKELVKDKDPGQN